MTSNAVACGQRVEQIGDETVGVRKLACEVVVVQAELVRDGVDARVVRVDEPLAGVDQARAVLDERGRRVPADEPGAAQVRVG